MHFEQRIRVKADPAQTWAFLWDVERLARCLPGCEEARELEPGRRYEALVVERVGPFRTQFALEVKVVEEQTERLVRLHAAGKDQKLGTSFAGELEVRLQDPDAEGTALDILADIRVVGKIAGLGQVAIKRKAQDIMGRFGQAIVAELGSGLGQ